MAYASIPTVLRPQELMDKAFGRAAKLEAADRNAAHRHRKTVIARLEAVRNILDDTLGRTVKKFPSLDQIVPYHLDLVRLLIGEDEYRMTLGSVDRTRKNVVELVNRTMHQIGKETDRSILADTQRRTYGRVSSYLRALDGALARLANYRSTLQRFPAVEPGLHTVVIAGYPNVGKSSLIRALSNAEPEVASYPFTTKSANVGHMFVQRPEERFSKSVVRIQLIDTPGLLDRPGEERNAIEHQATLAIRHLADLVLFLRDRTGHCGYPTDVQDRLLDEVRGLIGDVPLYVIESKTDVESQGGEPHADTFLSVSATTGIGIPELTEFLVERVTREPEDAALDEFLRGQRLVSYRASPESH